MKINDKNLNALSYKVKNLMALDRNKEALVFIKQALSIKHTKTLYKYLVEIEKETNVNNFNNSEEKENDYLKEDKKVNHKEEYRRTFSNSTDSINPEKEKDNKTNLNEFIDKVNIKEHKSKNEEKKESEKLKNFDKKRNHSSVLYKLIYLFFKIIKENIKSHKSLLFIGIILIALYNRNKLKDFIKFFFRYYIFRMI